MAFIGSDLGSACGAAGDLGAGAHPNGQPIAQAAKNAIVGSHGSPSPGLNSDVARATRNGQDSDAGAGRLQEVHGLADDPASPAGKRGRKKGGQRSGGRKRGKGLRLFSMKVREIVERKGRTSYKEVADEIVAEFTNPASMLVCPNQQQHDEKNIRRRVYDALNVFMAMEIISKERKEILWIGLPSTTVDDTEQWLPLQAERIRVSRRIEEKAAYLHELEEQIKGFQNLVTRNERMCNGTSNLRAARVPLPFTLVQTRPQATVEVEMSDDMQLVHLDFNSTPFELHDEAYVLKAMTFCEHSGSPEGIGPASTAKTV